MPQDKIKPEEMFTYEELEEWALSMNFVHEHEYLEVKGANDNLCNSIAELEDFVKETCPNSWKAYKVRRVLEDKVSKEDWHCLA